MKTIILMLSFLSVSLFASAQKTPPSSVSNTFASKFKNAEKVKWDMEEADEWEAEFMMNGKESSASFDLSGKWLETETEIKENELPAAVKNTLDSQYAGYKIEESESIESPDFTGYEIALENKEKYVEVQVTPNGKLTVKTEMNENDEEED